MYILYLMVRVYCPLRSTALNQLFLSFQDGAGELGEAEEAEQQAHEEVPDNQEQEQDEYWLLSSLTATPHPTSSFL